MAGNMNVSLIFRAIDRATGPIRKVTNNFQALRSAKVRADKAFQAARDYEKNGETQAAITEYQNARAADQEIVPGGSSYSRSIQRSIQRLLRKR